MIPEAVAAVFLVAGALFMLIAAIGVLRMPDLLMRMQAATKAAALGSGLMLLAAMLYFWTPAVSTRALAAIVFIFLTLPIAAHLLSRAAYLSGIQVWQETKTGLPDPYREEPEEIEVDATEEADTTRSDQNKTVRSQ